MKTEVRKRSLGFFFKRTLLVLLSSLVLLLTAGTMYEAIAGYIGVKNNKATGELVDAGDFDLHLYKQGKGEATVILETGSGATSTSWGNIPEELSQYATVVTYDRGGYGWSDEATSERNGENIVKELYTALQNADVKGPYILVGHSIGGMYARLFAQTYSDDVEGLILLDARPEDYTKATEDIFEKAGVDAIQTGAPPTPIFNLLKYTGVLRFLAELGLTDIPKENVEQTINIELRSKAVKAIHEELDVLHKTEEGIRKKSLGELPLTVVTHGVPIEFTPFGLTNQQSGELEEIWQKQQKQLLSISDNSQLVVAEKSGHSVMFDEPQIVIDVTKDMIKKVTKGK